jgi:putative ABC transport system substrate-binding protein
MRRREFIPLVGSAAAAWPVAARAQQAIPVIGILNSGSPGSQVVALFKQGLKEAGFVEGQNVAMEYRWAEDHYERLPLLAADLVRRQVALIFANTASAPAAKAATTTIPIVFRLGSDPVKDGLVASLNHPGGNLTGVVSLAAEVGPKRLELIHELVPSAATVALLVNPANPIAETLSSDARAAARTLGLGLYILRASTEDEIIAAFSSLTQHNAGAVVIGADAFFFRQSAQLAALAARHRIPSISPYRSFATAGGLMSYGGRTSDADRLSGLYAARILKGEKPADMPVQQLTNVELIINLKTAKALGISVSLPLLGRADEVIE